MDEFSDPEELDDSPIRILLANLQGLFAQLVLRAIEDQPNMVLAGQVEGQMEILVAARAGVDVVILGAPQLKPIPGICSHLLNEFPHLKIMVLATHKDGAMGYWLGVRRCRIKMVSAATLLDGVKKLSTLSVTV